MSGGRKAILVLGILAAPFMLFEFGFRIFEGPLGVDRADVARARRWLLGETAANGFAPHPYTLYTHQPGWSESNALGFLGEEFRTPRRQGVPRIACLGSSTTEGGNILDHDGSFPHFLEQILGDRLGREVEVLNFGMMGWTSAETLLNYLLVVQDFAPDIVLIHEAVNDAEPRVWPGFRADYSHYRQPWTHPDRPWSSRALLALSDAFVYRELRRDPEVADRVPVTRAPAGPYLFTDGKFPPGTEQPFRRNIRSILEHVRVRGGRAGLVTMPYDLSRARQGVAVFVAGLDEHNAILRELAREEGADLVDLDALAREQFDRVQPAFLDLVHMAPEGNRWKAEAIAKALLAGELL